MIASTRGEPDGFTEFVRARGGSLHRTAMLLTHDHAAAEDLVQTALAKAWQNWPALRISPHLAATSEGGRR